MSGRSAFDGFRMINRYVACTFSLLVAAVVCFCWPALTPPDRPDPLVLQPQTSYQLQTQQRNRAVFDLAASTDDYLLIVSDLSESGPHSVSLSSETISGVTICTGQPIRGADPGQLTLDFADVANRLTSADDAEFVACTIQTPDITAHRHFDIHAHGKNPREVDEYERVAAKLIAAGKRVHVYGDLQYSEKQASRELASEIVRLLENPLLDGIQAEFGELQDVDKSGGLTILLTPWLQRLQNGAVRLNGFVRAADFSSDVPAPFSNRADMLYINSQLDPEKLPALLAHELTHAVCCSRNSQPDDDWISEGIAHLAEARFAEDRSNLDHRVSEFLQHSGRYPLVVRDYLSADLFRSHGCRGSTFLFFRWCEEQNSDFAADLANARGAGKDDVAASMNRPFAELYRDWTNWLAESSFCRSRKPSALQQPIGGFGLTGIRESVWATSAESTFEIDRLPSYAPKFIRVPAAASPRRIRVLADAHAELQLVVRRIVPRPKSALEIEFTSDNQMLVGFIDVTDGKSGLVWVSVESDGHDQRMGHVVQRADGLSECTVKGLPPGTPLLVKALVQTPSGVFCLQETVSAPIRRLSSQTAQNAEGSGTVIR